MKYENVAKIVQISDNDLRDMTRKVNAYISDKHGWAILSITQVGGSADGYWTQPVFILGHWHKDATEPKQDVYSKKWE